LRSKKKLCVEFERKSLKISQVLSRKEKMGVTRVEDLRSRKLILRSRKFQGKEIIVEFTLNLNVKSKNFHKCHHPKKKWA